jgi:hypothetical protein
MGLRKVASLSSWYMGACYESDDILCILALIGQVKTVPLYSIHIARLHKRLMSRNKIPCFDLELQQSLHCILPARGNRCHQTPAVS